jgi:hypothetical protein
MKRMGNGSGGVRARWSHLAVAAGLAASTLLWSLAAAWGGCQPATEATPVGNGDPAEESEAIRDAQFEEMMEEMPFEMNLEGMTSGEGVFGAMFGPPITQADFDGFVRLLNFQNEQKQAAALIYSQRMANYQAKAGPLQKMLADLMARQMQAMRDGEHMEAQPTETEMKKLNEVAKAADVERAALRTGVMDDLRSLLGPGQDEAWQRVEMADRRNRLLRAQSMLMVESGRVDLRAVLARSVDAKAVDATVSERVGLAMSDWDQAIDVHARAMAPIEEQLRSAAFADDRAEQMDKQMKLMGQGVTLARRVIATTEASQRAIAAELPPDLAEKFTDGFLRAAHPRIYRTRHGERTIDAALAFTDLTAEQRGRLTALRDAHQTLLKRLRPDAIKRQKAQDEFQAAIMAAKDDAERAKVMESSSEVWSQPDPMGELRGKDNELVKQVRRVLTEEQRKRLPKRPVPAIPGGSGR